MFYYLLAGASEEERKAFHLLKPEEYHYLNQVGTQKHTRFLEKINFFLFYFIIRQVIQIQFLLVKIWID